MLRISSGGVQKIKKWIVVMRREYFIDTDGSVRRDIVDLEKWGMYIISLRSFNLFPNPNFILY